MRSLDELFDELAATGRRDASGFAVDALRRRADRRRRTRWLTGAAAVVVAAVGGLVAINLFPSDDARVESIDPGPTATSAPVDVDGDEPDGEAAVPTSDPVAEQYALDPAEAGPAMAAVEAFLAALAVNDAGRAAELWSPDAALVGDDRPDGDEAEARWLSDWCAANDCTGSPLLVGARRFRADEDGDERVRAEVFLTNPAATAFFTVIATRTPTEEGGGSEWLVASPPPTSGQGLLDRLFPVGPPPEDAVVIVALEGVDAVVEGELVRTIPGPVVDPWIRRGWLHREQGWVDVDDPTVTCPYSPDPRGDGTSFYAHDIVTVDGRWYAELLAAGDLTPPNDRTVFWDCESGGLDPGLADLGRRWTTETIDWRLFAPSGASIRYVGGSHTEPVAVITEDGTEVVLNPDGGTVGSAAYDDGTTGGTGQATVAYLETGDDAVWRLVVRALPTGEMLVEREVPAHGQLGYDGRYVTYTSGTWTTGPMDGTLVSPGGRIVTIHLESGTVTEEATYGLQLFLG